MAGKVIKARKFLRDLFGGGDDARKITSTPVVPPEVLDKVSRKYQYKTKIVGKDKVVPMSQHEVARQERLYKNIGLDKILNKKPSATSMAKPDKKALAAARKANQPVGRTKQDRLREFVEAGGYNAKPGDFVSEESLARAIARLKKRTRKATPAEAELIPKLNKDEFEAALKTADEVPLAKPPTAGADEVPLAKPLPASFTESVEANLERLASEGVEQGAISPEVKEIIMRSYRGKGKKP